MIKQRAKMKKNKLIIGFAGRQRSGKTSLSNHLRDTRNAEVITIADSLKNICANALYTDIPTLNKAKNDGGKVGDFVGFSRKHTFEALFSEIAAPMDIVKPVVDSFTTDTTVREFIQKVGTNIIRKYNNDWHVEKLKDKILTSDNGIIAIDDVRFPNEVKAIEELGGKVFFIVRPDLSLPISNHSSETSLKWQDFNSSNIINNYLDEDFLFQGFDYLIDNNFLFAVDCPILKKYNEDWSIYDENFGLGKYQTANIEVCKKIEDECLSSMLKNNGIIFYHTTDYETSITANLMLYKNYHDRDTIHSCQNFCIWNPYIIENFKTKINK